MLKKTMSIVIVFAFVFSLIQMMPARAEEYVEEKTNKNENQIEELVESKLTGGLNAPKPSEEEWKRVMEEQEKLMTPEIRASIRENVLKNLEKQNLKNKDFVAKNSKPSDYGFKTQAEYQKWLEEPFSPMKSSSSGTLSLNYTEYALKVGSSLTLEASGYATPPQLHWLDSHSNALDVTVAPNGNFYQTKVKAVQPGTGWVSVHDYAANPYVATGCTFESISLTLNASYLFLKTGESFTVTATTSHSDSRIALRTDVDGSFIINGNTFTVADNPTTSMTNIYAYLVDRPTVVECFCVEITNYGQKTITASVSPTTCHCGESVTVSATTNPPNAEVVWSVETANGGYFKGNAFYPQRTGFVTLRATIAGTNIYSEKSIYAAPRHISLSENRVTRTLIQGGFPLGVTISHGSLYDLTYDIEHPEVAEILYFAGYPYVSLKQTGTTRIIIDTPGSSDNVFLFLEVVNGISFSSAPAALYSSYTYTFEIYTTASADDLAVLTMPTLDSTTTTSVKFEAVENQPNKYRFNITAGNEGEHFYVVVFEGATSTEISKEYTVLPKSQAPDVGIVKGTNLTQTVYNENADSSGKVKVDFTTYKTLNGDKCDQNADIIYSAYSDGGNLSFYMSGNQLIITPQRVSGLDGLDINHTAHRTGKIVVTATLKGYPDKFIRYTVNLDCKKAFMPDAANGCQYLHCIEDHGYPAKFSEALARVGVQSYTYRGGMANGNGKTAKMNLLEAIQSSKVFAIYSHGTPGSIAIDRDNEKQITRTDINMLHNGYLNSTNLVLSMSCWGADNEDRSDQHGNTIEDKSILNAFLSKGVKCVIGFNGKIQSSLADAFESRFYDEIKWNDSRYIYDIYYSIKHAESDNCDDIDLTNGARFAGSHYTKFNS